MSTEHLEELNAFEQAKAYFEQRNWRNAIWAFEDAMLDDDADEAECMYYRARCKQEMGDLAGAMVDYAIALDRESEYTPDIEARMQAIRDYYRKERGIELPEPQQSVLNAAIRV